jgi:hypothetical protein
MIKAALRRVNRAWWGATRTVKLVLRSGEECHQRQAEHGSGPLHLGIYHAGPEKPDEDGQHRREDVTSPVPRSAFHGHLLVAPYHAHQSQAVPPVLPDPPLDRQRSSRNLPPYPSQDSAKKRAYALSDGLGNVTDRSLQLGIGPFQKLATLQGYGDIRDDAVTLQNSAVRSYGLLDGIDQGRAIR